MLRVLGPDATLRRGYSITADAKGNVIQTVRQFVKIENGRAWLMVNSNGSD